MEDNIDGIKTLTINGVMYAKYLMEGDLLYLNVNKATSPNNVAQFEDFIADIVSLIERKKFKGLAYLNIDAEK